LWIWGWIALAAAAWKFRDSLRALARPLLWIAIGLLPYCFLTYSRQIPSRQTYLARAGLALVCGVVFVRARSYRFAPALAVVVLMVNVGTLWTKKRAQFLQRAEPTELIIQLARRTEGPIWVRCFPRPGMIADEAVRLATGRERMLVWSEAETAARKPAAEYCYQDR
jgi:hypothetical protein